VVDYFRAYRKAETDPIVSGATYKIRNAATGRYLDSELNGGLTLTGSSTYDDQRWVATRQTSGAWTFRNVRTGRYYLDTEATNNAVIWNAGEVIADSSWNVESATGGVRLRNATPGRSYMYGTSAGEVKWNTGSTDSNTVWAFERQ
jgi:hypothetical protein